MPVSFPVVRAAVAVVLAAVFMVLYQMKINEADAVAYREEYYNELCQRPMEVLEAALVTSQFSCGAVLIEKAVRQKRLDMKRYG